MFENKGFKPSIYKLLHYNPYSSVIEKIDKNIYNGAFVTPCHPVLRDRDCSVAISIFGI